ncbi:MAG: hypothetical protein ABI333_30275 [bacterium]
MSGTQPHAESRQSHWERVLHSRWASWALLFVVAVLALGRIRPEVVGANDASRYATMIALVERSTLYIDGVPLARHTMDKVRVRGRELSTKPPLLSVIGAGFYAVLHHGFGLSFRRHEPMVVVLLVALLCTLPLLLLLWAFHGLLRREGAPARSALGVTALLGLGTLCFPFGTILVNHLPSTAALFGMFACARELRAGRATGWRYAAGAGLLGCLAVTFELTAVFPVVALTGYLFWGRFRADQAGIFLLGAVGPAALHLALTWVSTGGPLPVQLRPELWSYEGSYWNAPRSWDALQEPKWRYGLLCFFGGRGLFTLTPVLLLALPALWRGLWRGTIGWRDGAPGRAETVAVSVGFLGLASFIILRTNNYGGGHYGMRWFLMMVPLLLFLMQPVLSDLRSRAARLALALLILPGFYTAQIFWFGMPTAYELLLMRHDLLILPP